MTVSALDLSLYALALLLLFLTPGPVWLAMLARTVSGGFQAAWPLAIGVAVGDVIWPLLAILGLAWITQEYDFALIILRWVACVLFIGLGITVIRNARKPLNSDSRLTRPGIYAGFAAGMAAILGNPKAILFYMGVLPGFFDTSAITAADIVAICVLSMVVPLLGNLILAWFVGRVRRLISSPSALERMNRIAGMLLIGVGLILPFA
jgi:threonine/homoserine/homoserine lactone efflux protein